MNKIKIILLGLFTIFFLYSLISFIQFPLELTLAITIIFLIALFLTIWSISYEVGLITPEMFPVETNKNAVFYVGDNNKIKKNDTNKKSKTNNKLDEIHNFLDNLDK